MGRDLELKINNGTAFKFNTLVVDEENDITECNLDIGIPEVDLNVYPAKLAQKYDNDQRILVKQKYHVYRHNDTGDYTFYIDLDEVYKSNTKDVITWEVHVKNVGVENIDIST